jgi:hypothetical protein
MSSGDPPSLRESARGHVAHRSQHDAGFGVIGQSLTGLGSGRAHHFGQAEVQILTPPFFVRKSIVGFQITMNDSVLVRGGQAQGDLPRDLYGSLLRQEPAVEPVIGASRRSEAR